jgi:signal transduction histidine kinase/CheY-like chemotaxis protein
LLDIDCIPLPRAKFFAMQWHKGLGALFPPQPSDLDELRSEQIAAMYRGAAPGTFGSMFAAAILSSTLFFVGAVPLWASVTFASLVTANSILRLALIQIYRSRHPAIANWRPWAVAVTLSALGGGICWGLASWLLMDPARAEFQLLVFLCCAGLSAGAITAFGMFLPAYYCNLFPMMVPTVIWSGVHGGALHWTYAVLASLWIVVVAMLARTFSRTLVESLRLQLVNLALANDLRRQKEIAEHSNVAKSRFLAAASHDLRQPVHALSMFAGALQGRKLDVEGRQLVTQIQGSIESLDGLFNSILDVSRLDAGVVEVRPRSFAIQPLLDRIYRDERPDAEQKGLELRFVPSRAIVHTDPVLLERILRNLVSNAVRYTHAGRVIVGCRRGDRVSIEVWDTGGGIPEHEHQLIFQEFYQVGNHERSRSRGLGLGLAIVRRLSSILDLPITLRSRLGAGSAFKIAVPRGEVSAVSWTPQADDAIVTNRALRVFVIDDEVEIQAAVEALLSTWGHSVIAAGSLDEILTRIPAGSMPPDLIISDYRLSDGENGLESIQHLRSKFNCSIPAILVTGDTAPDRLREATASGCFLMHKPTSNARLRAAITNLTRSDKEARA